MPHASQSVSRTVVTPSISFRTFHVVAQIMLYLRVFLPSLLTPPLELYRIYSSLMLSPLLCLCNLLLALLGLPGLGGGLKPSTPLAIAVLIGESGRLPSPLGVDASAAAGISALTRGPSFLVKLLERLMAGVAYAL